MPPPRADGVTDMLAVCYSAGYNRSTGPGEAKARLEIRLAPGLGDEQELGDPGGDDVGTGTP